MTVTVNKKSVSAKGHTSVQTVKHNVENGKGEPEVNYFEFLVGLLDDQPTCNVNVNLGARIGLPEYSDVRFGVSLTVPCLANEKAVIAAYDFAKNWCKEKMEALHDEVVIEEEE